MKALGHELIVDEDYIAGVIENMNEEEASFIGVRMDELSDYMS
jgi:hypothetical protein